jgi:integrase
VIKEYLVSIKGARGLYIRDKLNIVRNSGKEATPELLQKILPKEIPYEIVGHITVRKRGRFRTFRFPGSKPVKQAINEAYVQREVFREEVRTGTSAPSQIPTLDKFFTEYIERRAEGANSLSDGTIDTSKYMYKNWAKREIGNMRLDEIQYEHIQSLIDSMRRKGLAGATQKRLKNSLSPVMSEAIRRRYIKANPVSLAVTDPVDNVKSFELSEAEAKRVYETILSLKKPFERALALFVFTGRRIDCEAARIRWEDVDLENDRYTLTGKRNTKNKVPRVFPLIPPLAEALRAMPARDKGFIFSSVSGDNARTSGSRCFYIWAKIRKLSGVNMTAHECRNLIGHVLKTADGVANDLLASVFGHSRGGESVTGRYAFSGYPLVKKLITRYIELIEQGGWSSD